MPKRGRAGCMRRHIPFVMNSTPNAYFRRPTLVHNFCVSTLPAALRLQPKQSPGLPDSGFHHHCNSRDVPGTSVDSTFQVLLCSGHSGTFTLTAQTIELPTLPFRATVRVRR